MILAKNAIVINYPFAKENFDLTHPMLTITFIARKILN